MGIARYIQMAVAVTAAIGTVMAAPAPTGTTTLTGTVNVTCVDGVPAVPYGDPNPHLWPINNFALVKPSGMRPKSYTLDKAWVEVHKLGHGGFDGGGEPGFSAMQCQFYCENLDGCVAFNTNTDGKCTYLNELIHPSAFVLVTDNVTIPDYGDYNALCNPPPYPIHTAAPAPAPAPETSDASYSFPSHTFTHSPEIPSTPLAWPSQTDAPPMSAVWRV